METAVIQMRIIVISGFGKKLRIAGLSLLLWISLFFFGSAFNDKSAPLFAQADIPFLEYDSPEGKFSFRYPSSYILEKETFQGGDILYHIGFHDSSGITHGFLQVWDLPGNLKDFLEKSKETSHQNFKSFHSKAVNINGVDGYLWDYSVLTGNGYYKGMEVFLQKGGRMYRLSSFLPEKEWSPQQAELFRKMMLSLKIRNSQDSSLDLPS